MKCVHTSDGKCRCPNVKKALGHLIEFDALDGTNPESQRYKLKGYAKRCTNMWNQKKGMHCQLVIFAEDGFFHYADFVRGDSKIQSLIKHFNTEETVIFKLEHDL